MRAKLMNSNKKSKKKHQKFSHFGNNVYICSDILSHEVFCCDDIFQ